MLAQPFLLLLLLLLLLGLKLLLHLPLLLLAHILRLCASTRKSRPCIATTYLHSLLLRLLLIRIERRELLRYCGELRLKELGLRLEGSIDKGERIRVCGLPACLENVAGEQLNGGDSLLLPIVKQGCLIGVLHGLSTLRLLLLAQPDGLLQIPFLGG